MSDQEPVSATDRHALRSLALPAAVARNGHWPTGFFAREEEDPSGTDAKSLDTRKIGSDVVVVFNDAERIVFFTKLWEESRATLETLTPWRVRTAWRVVREMATIAGVVAEDERLEEIETSQPDPWTEHAGGSMPDVNNAPGHMRRAWPLVEALCGDDALSLLPPDVPPEFRDEQGVLSHYDPLNSDHDPRLHRYIDVVNTIARYLHIEQGSIDDPQGGQRGMVGLREADLVRLAFPSRLQLFAWEDVIVNEGLELLYKSGQVAAQKDLQLKYGLREREAVSVVRMAMALARRQMESVGVEDHRALMVIQLQDQIRRFAAQGDNRNELAAMKQLAIVLGINKTDPADLAKEFMEIVASRDRRKAPEGRAALELVRRIPALVHVTDDEERELGGVGRPSKRAVPAVG